MSEADDGGLYHCRKCRRTHDGSVPEALGCPVSNAEHNAVAWLGQAGLYRTRLEAVQNGEQRVEPVSPDKLFELARSHIREACINA
ncbi:hypothetical protein Q5O_20705 [Pseudomonas putida JB]|nr:hypothetical protein Q5O_20705 [Pseudomonas putida JB]